MDELLNLYVKLPEMLIQVSDDQTVLNADMTMSRIEELHPELLRNETKYVQCVSGLERIDNLCVFGADGHAIVGIIRKYVSNINVVWCTNPVMIRFYPADHFDGMILSEKAIRAFMEGVNEFSELFNMIRKDGFLLFDILDYDEAQYLRFLNCNDFVPGRVFDDRLIYSVYKPNKEADFPVESFGKYRCIYSRIYCVCPAMVKTGGSELMHQLVYWINKLGGNAYISYVRIIEEPPGYAHTELADYVAGHVDYVNNVVDISDNAIVIPEIWPKIIDQIERADIYFWWMSVDNFINACKSENNDPDKVLETLDRKTSFHLVQSEYARSFLIEKGVSNEKIVYLSDYLNETYISYLDKHKNSKRKDYVLYNPKKGRDYVEKLMGKSPDINWIPIENMTTDRVMELMSESKIYVDFGNHPGKDRIPREAAASGCVVITGRKGSAAYREDVTIPEKYKIDEETVSADRVIDLIKQCIEDYEVISDEFEEYRIRIKSEKNEFIESIKKCFFR